MSADLIYHRLKYGWLVGVALAFLIFVVIAGYSARMTNDYSDYDQGRAEARKDTLEKVRKTEDALINPVDDQGNPTAKWVDQGKGLIQIPISEAMAHELADLKSVAVGEGAVIPGTTPAPAPAAAATNAAPATPAPAASTNAAPVAPATSTNAPSATPESKTPAKPKKPAKPVKTTSVAPEQTQSVTISA